MIYTGFRLVSRHIWFILLILVAFVLYAIVNFPSGSYYCYKDLCGYFFWGSHAHDGIWHMAIVETAFKRIPFIMPSFSSQILQGYNYLYDIGLLALAKVGLPPIYSYFKVVPMIWFIVFTFLIIKVGNKINSDHRFVWMLLFFTYFTGSFSYYFTIIKDKTIWGSSGILAQLPQHILLNMQFAISLLFLLIIILMLLSKKITRKAIYLFGVIVFTNMGLKFYGGLISYLLIIFFLIYQFNKNNFKRILMDISIITLSFIISIFVFYNPWQSLKTGSIFVFSPFTFIHPITEDPNLLNFTYLTNLRYTYVALKNHLRLIPIELINLTLFLIFYFGIRFLGLCYGIFRLVAKRNKNIDLPILLTILTSIAITSLFIQKGEWTNIVQFLYYGIFLSTFYIAELAFVLFKKFKHFGYLLVLMLIVFALPSTLDIFKLYCQYPPHAYLPVGEYEALKELKKMPDGVVLTPLYNQSDHHQELIKQIKEKKAPFPLYAWEDTAYVAAISGKQQYLADLWMARITGLDYDQRLERIKKNDCSILKEVDYVYFNNEYKIPRVMFDCPNKLKMVFANLTSTVYRVKK